MWNNKQINSCAATISDKFNEPTLNKTAIKIKPIETSYAIICAADRNAPKKHILNYLTTLLKQYHIHLKMKCKKI